MFYAPGDRALARDLFRAIGCRVLDPQEDAGPADLGAAAGPYLVVFVDPESTDLIDNVMYASEVAPEQWALRAGAARAPRVRCGPAGELRRLPRELRPPSAGNDAHRCGDGRAAARGRARASREPPRIRGPARGDRRVPPRRPGLRRPEGDPGLPAHRHRLDRPPAAPASRSSCRCGSTEAPPDGSGVAVRRAARVGLRRRERAPDPPGAGRPCRRSTPSSCRSRAGGAVGARHPSRACRPE